MITVTLNRDKKKLYIDGDEELNQFIAKQFKIRLDGAQFIPSVKAGKWDGYLRFFNHKNGSAHLYLIFDILKMVYKNTKDVRFRINGEYVYDFQSIKEYIYPSMPHMDQDFQSVIDNPEKVLREYQENGILKALDFGQGLLQYPTASGKSLIIYTITQMLPGRTLIMVPTTQLVLQFYDDFLDYSMGRVKPAFYYGLEKNLNAKVVMTDWQTLQHHMDVKESFDYLIVDEVHKQKSSDILKIVKDFPTRHCFGFTATMPPDKIDMFNVKQAFGEVIAREESKTFIEDGFLSDVEIICIKQSYPDDIYDLGLLKKRPTYREVMEFVMRFPERVEKIRKMADHFVKQNKNVLILVAELERDGDPLNELIKPDYYINGRINPLVRKGWIDEIKQTQGKVIIATFGTFEAGINIPNLDVLILATPTNSITRVIQSIGRVLRKYGEGNTAIVVDFFDDIKFVREYIGRRFEIYKKHYPELKII